MRAARARRSRAQTAKENRVSVALHGCAAGRRRQRRPLRAVAPASRVSTRLRVAVFLVALAPIALHPATRHAFAELAGRAVPWPRECHLEARGAILCLDDDGQSYRAR